MLNWEPKSQMQRDVLESCADIVCAGGSSGTYKSETLLIDAVQEYDNPKFHGILFRETFPELSRALIPRAHGLYSQLGATYNSQEHSFTWPWGSVMRFAYMAHEADVFPHQGAEYSWIGFDESTHQTEQRVRYLLSRLRSTDSSLHLRMRLATNPGGPGHGFHYWMFLGNTCPHCGTGGRQANKIYTDATWLSDHEPVLHSTQYIFGKWDPQGLLPNYDKQLKTQSPATAKALLAGCWRQFEGQYFDIWDPKVGEIDAGTMVVNRRTVNAPWWLSAWSGSDYGYSGSAAASVFFVRTEPVMPHWPEGRILALDEYPSDVKGARREPVRTFAQNVYDRFMKKQEGVEQPRRIEANYLGPDSWNDRGDLHTLAGQMNEILDPHGLAFDKADNDRAGGAQLMYAMLQSREFGICDSCPNTIEAIESRIRDPKEPVKVFKDIGDPLDDYYDACVGEGTMVATEHGEVPIEQIREGDFVWTRRGLRRVLWSGPTGWCDEPTEIQTDCGRSLVTTGNHEIWTANYGWKRVDKLAEYGDYAFVWKRSNLGFSTVSELNQSSLEAHGSTDFLTASRPEAGTTSSLISTCAQKESKHFTSKSGNLYTGQCRRIIISTILTETASTIPLKTSKQNTRRNISRITGPQNVAPKCVRERTRTGLWLQPGTAVQRVGHGTVPTRQSPTWQENQIRSQVSNACGVIENSKHRTLGQTATVRTPAMQRAAEILAPTILRRSARSVATISEPTVISLPELVPANVVRLSGGAARRVFNLVIDQDHEYIANGILVRNCRYGLYSYHQKAMKPRQMRVDERVARIWNEVSPMAAMMQAQAIEYEERKREGGDQGQYYGGNIRQRLAEEAAKNKRPG